ncbi:MAG TPA: exosortase/archaeosortase family protein [Verrucomicrobium sp.]|nr:exosortase/archaeosortase family protein [Verrucomicrobium sp.]
MTEIMRRRSQLIATMALYALAVWPSVAWYIRRMGDRSDEPLGLAALVTLAGILLHRRKEIQWSTTVLSIGSVVSLATQWLFSSLPPMIHAGGAFAVLLGAMKALRGKPGLTALASLSLPLMASLDFYAGSPMRLAAAEIATVILSSLGLGVTRAGTILLDGTTMVGVDPPCAGIRMLWTSLLVASVLATWSRLRALGTLLLMISTLALVVVGNALRATVLFFPESGRAHWPEIFHEGTGLVFQALVLLGVFWTSHVLDASRNKTNAISLLTLPAKITVAAIVFSIASLGAMNVAALHHGHAISATKSTVAHNWPETWQGRPLQPMPLSEREVRFATQFPGAIGRFACGDSELILRRVDRPTRLLHSSAGCLQAAGYHITPLPVWRDADGQIWGSFQARLGTTKLRVQERIVGAEGGQSYPDVSSWYWGAFWHPQEGPWLAATIISHENVTDLTLASAPKLRK